MLFFRVNSSVVVISNSKYIVISLFLFAVVIYLVLTNRNTRKIETRDIKTILTTDHKRETGTSSGIKFGFYPKVGVQNGVCAKSQPPWNNDWVISELAPFLEVYDRRPSDNRLGTPLMHQFALWCIIRHLKPKQIIESGVWTGLGTWMIRQAAPEAQLILLDPHIHTETKYTDRSNDTLYFTGKNFRDFSSIRNWKDVSFDVENTLVFVDDHQTPFMRIPQARRVGFKHMIFEDNYWLGFSDCLSLKQGCACLLDEPECKKFQYKDLYGKTKRNMTEKDYKKVAEVFEGLEVYAEFPMIWNVFTKGVTMVSERSTNYLFNTQNGTELLKELGLKWLPFKSMLNGGYTYANIAYARLKY